MEPASPPDDDLAALREAGPQRAQRLGEVFERHRARLERAVALRMDAGLRARLGASDVLQEAWIEAHERLPDYLADPRLPPFVWLRFLVLQRLAKAWRFHAGAQRRTLRRETPADAPAGPETDSGVLAERLIGAGVTPSVALAGTEAREGVRRVLDTLAPQDREVLGLRHFEELTSAEVARVLGTSHEAARKRHLRALERLAAALGTGGAGGISEASRS